MTPHEFKMTEGKQENGMCHQPFVSGPIGPDLPDGFVIKRIIEARQRLEEDLPGVSEEMKGKSRGFDSEAHRAFMRSLG